MKNNNWKAIETLPEDYNKEFLISWIDEIPIICIAHIQDNMIKFYYNDTILIRPRYHPDILGWAELPKPITEKIHDLKQCPFCSSNNVNTRLYDERNLSSYFWDVFCHNCGASGPHEATKENAIMGWNRVERK